MKKHLTRLAWLATTFASLGLGGCTAHPDKARNSGSRTQAATSASTTSGSGAVYGGGGTGLPQPTPSASPIPKPPASPSPSPSPVITTLPNPKDPTPSPSPSQSPSPTPAGPPALTAGPVAVIRGGGGTVQINQLRSRGWSGWIDLGGTVRAGAGVAAIGTEGRLDLAFRQSDGTVSYRRWSASSGWTPWENLGGASTYHYVGIQHYGVANECVVVFGLTNESRLAQTWRCPRDARWNPWVALSSFAINYSNVEVVSWGNNRLDVFVVDPYNRLGHTSFNGTWFGYWDAPDFRIASHPTAVSWGANRLDVFVKDINGALRRRAWTGTAWTDFEDLGGAHLAGHSAKALSRSSGTIDVFMMSSRDSAPYYRSLNGKTWTGWMSLGGAFLGGITGVAASSTRLELVGVGTNGSIWHRSLEGATPSVGWTNIGGTTQSGVTMTRIFMP